MNLINYLLEANLYLAAFYLLYVVLLRSETLYQLNRAYLLVTSSIAFIIPLIQLGILKPEVKAIVSVVTVPVDDALTTVTALPAVAQVNLPIQAVKWTFTDYVLALYGIVTLILLGYLIFKIIKLIALSKKGIAKRQRGFTVIEIPGQNVAFSFFSYLFVNTELLSSPTILHHEEVHIRQKHSWDVIYFELIKIINWFNPVVYLLQKSLKEVHEFIADQQVANAENGASDYAEFLISNAYGLTPIQLTNSFFNKNLLKRRIIMLYQKRSGKAARLKYLLTLPLLAALICASTMSFTNKTYGWVDIAPKITNPALKQSRLTDTLTEYEKGQRDAMLAMSQDKLKMGPGQQLAPPPLAVKLSPPALKLRYDKSSPDPIYNISDHQPQFPGGQAAFAKFLHSNVKYPSDAKEAHVQGRAIVQFVVEKDGSLSGVKLVHNPGMDLGAEAVRVLKLSPKWEPGTQKGKTVKVMFTVPVNFALDNSKVVPVQPNVLLSPPLAQNIPAPKPIQDVQLVPPPDARVYNAVETQPTFPGGDEGLATFLIHNVKYPAIAKENGVQGKVYLRYIVEPDGSLSNMKIVREPGSGLGDEAVRVLNLSPKWNPGIQKGQKVRVQFTMPINFSLTDDDNEPKNVGEFYKHIQNHVRYPVAAKDLNIQGRVFVSFTISADKKIQDLVDLRAPDKSLGDEVIRILSSYNDYSEWKTNTVYTLPVNFNINYGDGNNVKVPDPVNPTPVHNTYQPGTKEKVSLNEVVINTYGPVKQ